MASGMKGLRHLVASGMKGLRHLVASGMKGLRHLVASGMKGLKAPCGIRYERVEGTLWHQV